MEIDIIKNKRGLFVGRFQPFHTGHLNIVEEVIGAMEHLIIGIGSAKQSYTEKNPFTGGERAWMITEALEPDWRERCSIVPVDDINRYNVWVSHVEDLVPPFDIVVTRSDLTSMLFSEKGYGIYLPKEYVRDEYQGKRIRKLMKEGSDNWRALVPAGTERVIDEIGGVKRIRKIC